MTHFFQTDGSVLLSEDGWRLEATIMLAACGAVYITIPDQMAAYDSEGNTTHYAGGIYKLVRTESVFSDLLYLWECEQVWQTPTIMMPVVSLPVVEQPATRRIWRSIYDA